MASIRLKGRLFWRLVLALWTSMILSMLVAFLYLRHTLGPLPGPPPAPPPGLATIGPLPLVPLVTGMIAMLVVGVAVAWYLSVPLRHLKRGLGHVAQGRFDTRVAPLLKGRHDELTELAHDFDSMAARLQQLTAARQALLHDVSHEFRSPLARMQAAIGLLRQDASQAGAMVERIEREIDRLNALVEELLTLHRLEAAPESWPQETIDVLDLLNAVIEDADFEARAASRQVIAQVPGRFIARVRGELMYRAFENVIRNAVKFTAQGTAVEVGARLDPDGALAVTVADRGPGVPEAERERMFEPFVRLESASLVAGTGLGLAVAQRAMSLHGGTITAAPREGGGLVVELRLPV
jgi:two-component system, OmpR family, sensor kinase